MAIDDEHEGLKPKKEHIHRGDQEFDETFWVGDEPDEGEYDQGHDFDAPESQDFDDDIPREPKSAAENLMEREGLRPDDPRVQEKLLEEDEDNRRSVIQRLDRRYKARLRRQQSRRSQAAEHAKASERLRRVSFMKHQFEGWKKEQIPYRVEPKQDLDTVKDTILPPDARGHVKTTHPDDIRDVEFRIQKLKQQKEELKSGKATGQSLPADKAESPKVTMKTLKTSSKDTASLRFGQKGFTPEFDPTKSKDSFNKASTEQSIKTIEKKLKTASSDKVLYQKGELTSEKLVLQSKLRHAQNHLEQINDSLDRYDTQIGQLESARNRLKKQLKQEPITPPTEPVKQAPNQTRLKEEVAQYNALRKKDQTSILSGGTGLQDKELEKYYELEDKMKTYKLVVEPTNKARKAAALRSTRAQTPEEQEQERLQNELERQFPVEQEGARPKTRYDDIEGNVGDETEENIEGEIGKYGQEEPGSSWKSTYKFNKEQLKRKYKGLYSGETAMGLGGTPPEKARLTIGPNKAVIKQTEWKPVDDKNANKGLDRFEIELSKSAQPTEEYDKSGRYFKGGRRLQDTLDSLGLELDKPEHHGDGTKYVIKTKPKLRSDIDIQQEREYLEKEGHSQAEIDSHLANQREGVHLNPDQIAYLKQMLHVNYGLKSFKPSGTIKYNRQSVVVPAGSSKLPKGVSENDVVFSKYTKNLYNKPISTRFGDRDPVTGELLPNQNDTVGIHIPGVHKGRVNIGDRALQYHFKEDTDAIGWGTSWRPGNKEISSVALAYPRARRERHIVETTRTRSNTNLDKLIEQEHPEAETEEEKSQWRKRYRKHSKELLAAAGASGYYSAKKGLPSKIGGKIYYGATHIPGIGPKVENLGQKTNFPELVQDTRVVHKQLSNKMERAKLRILNPTASLGDPTRYGITSDKRLNIPKWRYRKFPIAAETREARIHEKDIAQLEGAYDTRLEINKFLNSGNKNIFKKWQAKAAVHGDPERRMSNRLLDAIEEKQNQIEGILNKRKVTIGDQLIGRADNPEVYDKFREELGESAAKLKAMRETIEAHPEQLAYEDLKGHPGLKTLWDSKYPHELRTALPKPIKIGGEVVLAGAVLGGGSIYAVDKYQTYKYNKGEHISHPILKAITPETISIPKLKVKKTRELTLPDNTLTNALDFEGEKIPVAWRASVVKEQKARLQNHIDISREGYKSGMPLLGGLGITAPTPPKGSITRGIVSPSPSSGLGPTKNMYVAGKKVPIDISAGKKERWDQKSHKLRAKYNRFKLSQDDREKLTFLANESPDKEEQIRSFYHGDKQLEDMMDDPEELVRIQKKLAKNKYASGGKKSPFTSVSDYTSSKYQKSQG